MRQHSTYRGRWHARLGALLVALALTVISVTAALAVWDTDEPYPGHASCFSPKTVISKIVGTDDHAHKHSPPGWTKVYYFDLSTHTSYKSYGQTDTDYYLSAKGNLYESQSYGWCTL